jgi:nucleotide-binding universal stress UspA family protein
MFPCLCADGCTCTSESYYETFGRGATSWTPRPANPQPTSGTMQQRSRTRVESRLGPAKPLLVRRAAARRCASMLRMSGAIIVGFDGHEAAARALERGISEAKAAGGRLVIVVVEETPFDPYAPPTFSMGPPQVVPPLSDRVEPAGLKQLADKAVSRAGAEGVSADLVWEVGDPMRTIVDAARDHNASSIILGAHHYNLLQRLLGEDVAAAVKRRADCEVITVE